MGKLQQITRNNGSILNTANIPKDIIEELNWKKGDDLDFQVKENSIIINKI